MRPADLGLPPKFERFRTYPGFDQLATARDLAEAPQRFQIPNMPTGVGKSLTYATVAALKALRDQSIPFRWLALVGTKELQGQLLRDGLVDRAVYGHRNYPCMAHFRPGDQDADADDPEFRCAAIPRDSCPYMADVRAALAARSVVPNYAYWLSIGRHGDPGLLGEFDFMVLDECFPAGTMIGDRPIEEIREGDWVSSFDPATRRQIPGRVVGLMQKPATELVRLYFGGRSVICTPNHPIFTPTGWVLAGLLTIGSRVLCSRNGKDQISAGSHSSVQLVRPSVSSRGPEALLGVSENGPSLLLEGMRESVCGILSPPSAERRATKGPLEKNAREQPHERSGDSSSGSDHFAGDGLEANRPGGQWPNATVAGYVARVEAGMEDGVSGIARQEEAGVSNTLQDRHRRACAPDRDRGGRPVASGVISEGPGSEEDGCLECVRVDDIEILEPGSDGTFGGLCPGGLVYNLEIENHHTYIANGLAVHNCHSAPDWLTRAAEVRLTPRRLGRLLNYRRPLPAHARIEQWGEWVEERLIDARAARANCEMPFGRKEARRLDRLIDDLEAVWRATTPSVFGGQPWIVVPQAAARRPEDGVLFSPRWGSDLAEQYLFRGVPSALLTSATITPGHAANLGVPAAESRFLEVPSPFDPRRRPVVWVPTVRVDFRMTDGARYKLYRRVDELIEAAIDQGAGNAVIHTGSYERTRELVAASRYAPALITHRQDSVDFQAALEKFKRAGREGRFAVIASPRMVEGVDLADDLARWQVILHVPFPNSQDPLTKVRLEDPAYRNLVIAETVTQMVGRPVRNDRDYATTVILDDHWGQHVARECPFAGWMRASFRTLREDPGTGKLDIRFLTGDVVAGFDRAPVRQLALL